jgi:disulfide bond formation protein DsbB
MLVVLAEHKQDKVAITLMISIIFLAFIIYLHIVYQYVAQVSPHTTPLISSIL